MKKELKDYLHLYLGCEIEVGKPTEYKWKLTAVQSDCNLIYARNNQDSRRAQVFIIDKVKPILRPLSDMTEDEEIEMNGSDRILTEGLNELEYDADRTRYLLSKHFDLFGLIESGLAIDKTTPNQGTNLERSVATED